MNFSIYFAVVNIPRHFLKYMLTRVNIRAILSMLTRVNIEIVLRKERNYYERLIT